MLSLSSLFCSLSGLLCISNVFMEINTTNFESYVLENVKNDNDKILFTLGVQTIKNVVDIPIFQIEDIQLEKYLGLNSETPISMISMKNNLTDFNTYLPGDISVSPTGELELDMALFVENIKSNTIRPLTFNQTGETHPILNMKAENDIYKEAPHITLFYWSVHKKTMSYANLIKQMASKFNMTFGCWDLVVSDPPVKLNYQVFPSIGITFPHIYGKHITQLRFPIYNQSIHDFIEANAKEYRKVKQV